MYGGYYQPYWTKPDELEHYGVLGMKWGVRRYQNADGTLTAAGKKRYAGATQEQIETSERRKKKVIKAVKVGAVVAGAALASGAAYYGLTHTAAGKAAVAAGMKAISNLVDGKEASNPGNYFTVENGETVYYTNGRKATPSTKSPSTGNEEMRFTLGMTRVDDVPDVSKDMAKYASPEYWAEYDYNRKKNRY